MNPSNYHRPTDINTQALVRSFFIQADQGCNESHKPFSLSSLGKEIGFFSDLSDAGLELGEIFSTVLPYLTKTQDTPSHLPGQNTDKYSDFPSKK